MIDWGTTPVGSVASLYLPAVSARTSEQPNAYSEIAISRQAKSAM